MTVLRKGWRALPREGGLGLVILALLAWLPSGCGQREGPPRQAQVVRVVSGDSAVLAGGARVRLAGVDAPEMERDGRPAQFLAHRARDYLAELVLGKTVRLEYERERYGLYGRLLAYLSLPDGVMANAALVRQGLARVHLHPPNVRHRETLVTAQQEAMAAGCGLWRQPLPPQDEDYYLGNRNNLLVHRPGCPLAAKGHPADRVRFDALMEAYRQGYSPCRVCQP